MEETHNQLANGLGCPGGTVTVHCFGKLSSGQLAISFIEGGLYTGASKSGWKPGTLGPLCLTLAVPSHAVRRFVFRV